MKLNSLLIRSKRFAHNSRRMHISSSGLGRRRKKRGGAIRRVFHPHLTAAIKPESFFSKHKGKIATAATVAGVVALSALAHKAGIPQNVVDRVFNALPINARAALYIARRGVRHAAPYIAPAMQQAAQQAAQQAPIVARQGVRHAIHRVGVHAANWGNRAIELGRAVPRLIPALHDIPRNAGVFVRRVIRRAIRPRYVAHVDPPAPRYRMPHRAAARFRF